MTSPTASEAAAGHRRRPACRCRPGKIRTPSLRRRIRSLPGPTSTTTPAPSPPIRASWVNMPRVIMMSRKLVAMARMATRTWPGSSGASALGTGSSCRFSKVPAMDRPQPPRPVSRRHQYAVNRPAAVHPRRVDRLAPHQHLRLTDRQHLRDCRIVKRRIGIHQHDPAGMLGLRRTHQTPHRGTRQIGDVLPRQSHCAPGRHHQHARVMLGQPRLHRGQTPMRALVGVRRTDLRRPAATSNTSYAGVSACDAADAADHTSSKSRSPPEPEIAAINCCCDTGRATIEATDNTGNPSPSANSTDTADGPDGAIRARTADAPAACNDTPCQENGSATLGPAAVVGYRRRMQGRIQQHRMHTESAYTPGGLRQRYLGEQLVAATPERGQALGTPGRTRTRAPPIAGSRRSTSTGVAPSGGHDRQIGARLNRSGSTTVP